MRTRTDLGAAQRNRIALYLGARRTNLSAQDLRPYFQGAKATGLRIVTVASEARRGGTRRPMLKRLIARMEAGEFEAIMTVVDADVTREMLPRPRVRGATWLPYPAEAR